MKDFFRGMFHAFLMILSVVCGLLGLTSVLGLIDIYFIYGFLLLLIAFICMWVVVKTSITIEEEDK